MDHLQREMKRVFPFEQSWGKHAYEETDKNQTAFARVAHYQWKNIAFEIPLSI